MCFDNFLLSLILTIFEWIRALPSVWNVKISYTFVKFSNKYKIHQNLHKFHRSLVRIEKTQQTEKKHTSCQYKSARLYSSDASVAAGWTIACKQPRADRP